MKRFILNTQNADAWRRLVLSGKVTPVLDGCAGITLAGALELFATALAHRDSCGLFSEIHQASARGHSLWRALLTEWCAQAPGETATDIHRGRQLEFFRLRTMKDKNSLNLSYFEQRFSSSMKQEGFPPIFSNALGKVIDEMADNVIQHSGTTDDGFTGIAGYHVQNNCAAFAVTDVVAGLLATLRTSPRWSGLTTSRAAIRAIAIHHASSRQDQGDGEGFKQLFKSLIDHNSLIRIRTDDAALTVGNSLNEREGGEVASPLLRGVQISIACGLRDCRAQESEITI